MSKVTFNMTMSLDGYVAGPNDSPEKGLGENGDRLFRWYETGSVEIPIMDGGMVLKVDPRSAELMKEATENIGAEVWGRKTFNITGGWGGHPPAAPCFIVTHSVPREWTGPDSKGEGSPSPFIFVTDGVESAIRQAKAAAGGKDVAICTASILQQALDAGLVDEITVNVVPYLLGGGVRLFDNLRAAPIELEQFLCIQTPEVTHLGFRVRR